MRLVLVHGRDQQGKDRAELKRAWLAALDIGLSNAELPALKTMDVEFPYYGDELERLVQEIDTPLVSDVLARGGLTDDRASDFRGRLLEELAASAGVTPAQINAKYSGAATEKGPLNWEWVQAILRALDNTPIGRSTIDRFTRDVYVYLTYPAVQAAVNKLVESTLTEEPCVVVAHSLGTVVTYRLLRDPACRAKVKRLITLGSPLGVNAIRDLIKPPALANPDGLTEWFNAYDPRDVVALRPLDEQTWKIRPLIKNKSDVDNHTKNRHGIGGYLDDATVARWIYEATAA
ncbi:MAG: hypothetical protein Q7V20_14485 [Aquabacterium sp.]|uniref:hypothetical protein n=1 Tax=Aquabacterium sp. TaxID=1872578 RepID=UPI002727CE34|nr:hypothetical protein [Aquabacterium sp.]MDO9004652.1 hypothetical protein [Aquabacterium sp.]